MDVRLPDGTIIRGVPDGITRADLTSKLAANGYDVSQFEESSAGQKVAQGVGNVVAGAVRGAGSIGATILAPYDIAKDALAGKGLSLESNRQRRADMDSALQSFGAEPNSLMYQGGKLAGEIAGTAGTGGVLAKGAQAVGAAPTVVNALRTAGMTTGGNPGVVNMLTRMGGGALTGGAAAGLIDPEQAGTGVVVGGALPPAAAAIGRVGSALGRVIRGPQAPQAVIDAAREGAGVGYVVPPTQVKPSLGNRLLEGLSGKITTAQNASAANQSTTNDLARKAIGMAPDEAITKEALGRIRATAGKAYEAVKSAGQITADPSYLSSLDNIAQTYSGAAKSFPGLAKPEVESLVASLRQPQFGADSAVDAIRVLRENATKAYSSGDKGLGKATKEAADALESLVDRHLQAQGNPDLLKAFRAARTAIAKTYSVEGALTGAETGNVAANKLAAQLQKGKPLSGELAQIAKFAQAFPKATQTVEKMGSLPQSSPLDWGVGAGLSMATHNPLMMATILARPAARKAILSPAIQSRLTTPASNSLVEMLQNPELQQAVYRTAPAISAR